MDRFRDKIAFVTGAASKRGMGRAIATRLAQEGANIIVADKYEAPPSLYAGDEVWGGLKEVVKDIETLGRQAMYVKADVSVKAEVDSAINIALKRFGWIDILVNCAGIMSPDPKPLIQMSDEEWNRIISVNLTGSFQISRAVGREMVRRKKGGKILHISSVAGKKGVAASVPYVVSKFGVIGLVQSLALDMAPYKINVNAICPGHIMTNISDERYRLQALAEGKNIEEVRTRKRKEMLTRIPMGYMAIANDVANLALFLVSSDADYMTGQAVNFSGGIWMS